MELPKLLIPGLEFSSLDFAFVLSRPVFIILFTIFFLLYALVSSVLFYHWSAYGMRSPGILVSQTLFLGVSVILFIVSGLAITYI